VVEGAAEREKAERIRGADRQELGAALSFLNLSLLSDSRDSFLPYSSFPGGDDWASGGAICPAFAQPFAGDERIPQFCGLLFLIYMEKQYR